MQEAQGTSVLGFGYDAAGRRTTITLPNSVIGTYGFDNADQLTSITYMNGSTTVGTLGYGYDLGGRRTSMTGTLAGFVPPNAVPALTYDGTNRQTSRAGTPLSYDANGNLTALGATTYTWNARNQLIATSGGGGIYAYDALGRRTSVTVSGVTTPYVYDGQNPAMISSTQVLAGAGLDEIYAQINSSGTTSYLRDGLNSTVALTNNGATTTANYSYSPYGDSVGSGTSTTPLQYTGRENDGATGLYYYRARYYSPALGRFISEDPIGLSGGTNYYAYGAGNPISEVDPLGLWSINLNVYVGVGTEVTFGSDNGRAFLTARLGLGVGLGAAYDPKGKIPGPDVTESCRGGVVLAATAQADLRSGPFALGAEVGAARNYTLQQSEIINENNSSLQMPWEGVELSRSIGVQITLYQGKH